MNPISEWLNRHGSYDEGVQLYMQYGPDPLLKTLLQGGHTPFKDSRLRLALRRIVPAADTAQPAAEKQPEKPAVKTDAAVKEKPKVFTGWPAEKDEVVAALHAQWKPLFAEMMNLMARVYDVAKSGLKDEARRREACVMAHRILDLDDACTDIYEKRDYYLEHKKLPDEKGPVALVTDEKKYPLALQNHKRYLREYKAKLLKHPGDVKIAAQIKKHQWAVAEYSRLLGIEKQTTHPPYEKR